MGWDLQDWSDPSLQSERLRMVSHASGHIQSCVALR